MKQMKTSILKQIFFISICSIVLYSCVPARQFDEMKKKELACDSSNAKLKKDNEAFSSKNKELQSSIEILSKRVSGLQLDSNVRGTSLRTMTENYDQLNKTYQMLLLNYKDLLVGNNTENQKLLVQLKTTQDSLINKEDAIKKLASDLNLKENNLKKLSKEIDEKQAKLNELQTILRKKDSTVKALKNMVVDALTGYEGNGLTISQKNGKIYVSLEESLLFASGSFTVDPKGVEAIKKLAKVLENNKNINILIEGHTDDVPFNGNGTIKDNWDLSVMRATAIVKIITKNSSVDPKRLTAAGRSEFDPIESNETKTGKAKNRRTEIILTPKLDELFQIIETY